MASSRRFWAAEVLLVWFDHLRPVDWFSSNSDIDTMLCRRFARDLAMLQSRPSCEFLTDPATALAAVLLFDQIPRNLFGTSAQAFAFDPLARAVSRGARQRGWDRQLTAAQRQFLYMPLMHSEHIVDQQRSVVLFARLPRRFGLQFARDHYRMIARFGRFPHRNEALGRRSTRAEQRALDAGFSW